MLNRDQDAFGYALIDYFAGNATHYIVERDDGYFEAEEIARYVDGYAKWSTLEREAAARVRGRVLDVGCGAGRYSLHLQKKGHRVVGIDWSPLAVQISRQHGLRDARVMGVADLRPGHGPFDTIIMMGNNLGLLGNGRRAPRLFRRFHRLTSDDGLIVAETMDPGLTRNPSHKRYQRLNRSRGRLPGHVRLRARYKECATPWFDYLFVSPAGLRKLVAGTGWRIRELIRSDGPSYVAVLEKTPGHRSE